MIDFLRRHGHALLYAGFWLSLGGYGLVAPPERVAALGSAVVTQGWQLSLMAILFGGPVQALYVLRMRRRDQ